MKAIIGTAGHIDHGKTTLIRALTGLETDRLPEEKSRGISIELGFAYLQLEGEDRAGIVDVPGHERFVRQMLAGAQGFDIVVVVVAADDGVMPQTEEHFEICHLLGVRRAVFVISKADLVSGERIEDVRGEIEILAAGTPFEDAPILAVSGSTGDGIDALRRVLVDELSQAERTGRDGSFRMPIDRAFVIKGHGVVVTGTAGGGSVQIGQELEIAADARRVRVRELQVHGEGVDRAFEGQRVAINLSGVDIDQVQRGDTLVTIDAAATSDRFDARVEIRPSAKNPVRSHERIRLYIGTTEVMGRIVWLGGIDTVAPRSTEYAQLFLREPIVAFPGDRFVLRDETTSRTLGGGEIVLAKSYRHKKTDTQITERLANLETGDERTRLMAFCDVVREFGASPGELSAAVDVGGKQAIKIVRESDDFVLLPEAANPQLVVSTARYSAFLNELVDRVETFHATHTNLSGMELESLRKSMRFDVDARLFKGIVDATVERGELSRRGSVVSLPTHEVSMDSADEELADRVFGALRREPTKPPSLKQLESEFRTNSKKLADVVGVLCARGQAVKVSSDLVFSSDVVEDVEGRLRNYLAENEQITAAGFRDLISASRKYSIPLLDYFDRSGVTVRSGDYRRLKSS